ncbi:biotin carboxylase N-terminal domain-containing protein [Fodinicola acaciae]|uniref:ATP-binding protein n=1 Tax=Fodinicola acaciae TaxID=2681555 RepID=UPI0013D4BE2D|nr:acetyl-CoA carboxylase biotin carboxylase subunit family protein [Fodinicola acaciae]
MYGSVLVADRGAVAGAVVRAARRLGIRTVAIHVAADRLRPFVTEADRAEPLKGEKTSSYAEIGQILEVARRLEVDAIHPGGSVLAADPDAARAVLSAGLGWIGASPQTLAGTKDKVRLSQLVADVGVPVPESYGPVSTVDDVTVSAEKLGCPVVLKAVAGRDGVGIAISEKPAELAAAYELVRRQLPAGDARILVQRCYPHVRHIEVQVLGLADGTVLALGERDCSVQRRFSPVFAESPAPSVRPVVREELIAAGLRAAEAVGLRGAGTVEFLLAGEEFYFCELRPQLTAFWSVTEELFGVDLVAAQFLVAAEHLPGFDLSGLAARGHAIGMRMLAEDPRRFSPEPGPIVDWTVPECVRVDAAYAPGSVISADDTTIATVVALAEDRAAAIARARSALHGFRLTGPRHTAAYFGRLLENDRFVAGRYDTTLLA